MFPNKVPPSIVILQPTTFCNIDCSYCYLPSRHLKHKMSDAVFQSFLQALINSTPQSVQNVLFSWHGGEPLSAGPEFFRHVFKESSILAKHNYVVKHAIQTNGILMSNEYADIFINNSVSVCVSIDGPEEFHDKKRLYRNGKGSFSEVMAGVEILRKREIKYTVLSVISEEHLRDLERYFSFISSLGIKSIGLLMPEIEGANKESFLNRYSDEDIKNFWQNVLTLAVKYKTRVRELDFCLLHFVIPIDPHTTTIPFAFLNVAYDGRYSTFDPELMGQTLPDGSKFFMGSLDGNICSDWANFESSSTYGDIVSGVNRCRATCQYFSACGGGPIGNKLFENGTFDSTETLACRFRIKRVVDALLTLSESDNELIDQYIDILRPDYMAKNSSPEKIRHSLYA